MDSLDFETLFAALRGLPLHDEEREQLRTWLGSADDADACIALIEQAAAGKCCPRCGGARSHRCGRASDLQRWRCLACGRSYNALTGTKLARLRNRACWLPYLRCLLESRTVRASAEAVQVHRTTSFRWRHRMVSGFTRERPAPLAGMVEADETYLLESQKGSRTLTRPARRRGGVASHRGIGRDHDCLLVACARGGAALDFHCGRGPVSSAQLGECLGPVLAPDCLLISDGAAAYPVFAMRNNIAHQAINLRAGERARGAIHLNHVNGWHSRFKRWLVRFHGVASRYLIHYSGWRRVLDAGPMLTPAQLLVVTVKPG
ncbi:IS1595 family transposase [Telluria beijingensis]|uniref:IS1595 family transposase n=1 Tax=Telluria beijingensis TaxID=3068633 RepID=UPI0027956E34|nr:IS1595 family transposase [Massilia sp. REN29]